MAKRRNLKKEKALRNQAYARKFRKRNNAGRGRRRMDSGRVDGGAEAMDQESTTQGAAEE